MEEKEWVKVIQKQGEGQQVLSSAQRGYDLYVAQIVE